MALATASRDAIPSVRFVLLKQADEQGFCFYTDIRSPKGRQLVENPYAAMVFYWHRKGRQVRVDGAVEQMSAREADDYWATRPLASRSQAASRIRAIRSEAARNSSRESPSCGGS